MRFAVQIRQLWSEIDLPEHLKRAKTRLLGEIRLHEQLADDHVHGVARGEEALAPPRRQMRDPVQILHSTNVGMRRKLTDFERWHR